MSRDAITLSYVVKGAVNHPKFADAVAIYGEGEIEFMDYLVGRAAALDEAWDEFEQADDWAGVFAYEAAEPLGVYLVDELALSGYAPTSDDCKHWVTMILEDNAGEAA